MQSISERTKDRVEELVKKHNISAVATVLDIGCADLRPYSVFLNEHFKNYTGVDYNNDLIKKIKQNKDTAHINAHQGNIEKLDFENEKFDLIVCNNMLAYTNTKLSIKEMERVLKKGGSIISLNNNTIAYSLYKMFRYGKLKEFIQSCTVILNTLLYRNLNVKIFHTTYFTKDTLNKDLRSNLNNCEIIYFEEEKIGLPYKTINFIIKKNA